MYYDNNWATVSPLANEEEVLPEFLASLLNIFDRLQSGKAYLVIDNASKDRTLEIAKEWQAKDPRIVVVWAPENRSVVDAYLKGYKVAYEAGHEFIIEIDGGMSHDPRALPMFIRVLNEGNECAFGSRYINGGSMVDSSFFRRTLSKSGSLAANILLGTPLSDMTSGYQGLNREIVKKLLDYPLKSKAHFYQTEVRYLLRRYRIMEVPIHYRAPSPSVSKKAIKNSISVFTYYILKHWLGNKPVL